MREKERGGKRKRNGEAINLMRGRGKKGKREKGNEKAVESLYKKNQDIKKREYCLSKTTIFCSLFIFLLMVNIHCMGSKLDPTDCTDGFLLSSSPQVHISPPPSSCFPNTLPKSLTSSSLPFAFPDPLISSLSHPSGLLNLPSVDSSLTVPNLTSLLYSGYQFLRASPISRV